jgi:ABC-2 type transport system ATP-binding protein
MNAIETDALTKYYGKNRGIEEISLEVKKGEFFGFIGPNGAGKSTLIRTLLGLISSTSGNGRVLGMDIAKNRTEILSRVGYLPSEVNFYPSMKVKDIIKLSEDLRKADCSDEADILCKRLDLDINKKVSELSLGNRKKLGIVCALQHKPDLYILDEPTSGLDPLMQKELYAILKERRDDGATVFLSSHVLSEIGKYCDRAAVIKEGRLVACDKVENLTAKGAKRVVLKGTRSKTIPSGAFSVKTDGDDISFLYLGEASDLLTAIAATSPSDFTVTDPDMDEAFMHYYGEEN